MAVLSLTISGNIAAQLSPGKLAQPHAHLEGLANCTQCHVIGKKVTNQKCLDCHVEIQDRLDAQRGYHVSPEVIGKDCFSCHSDHHGRNFQIVRFDENAFDHDLTGYQLEGAHQKQECRQCHTTEFIVDNALRERTSTYLGLDTDCMNCHDDYHQRTLSFDCRSCHDFEAFSPAPLFNHDQTNFALEGAHQDVDCASCHQVETRNGREFQEFAGITFGQCSDCHEDVHHGRFGTECRACHTVNSFQQFIGAGRFDHNITNFPLIGRHRALDCTSCHTGETAANQPFQEFANINIGQCSACHEDVHDGKFGADCRACHNESSFLGSSNSETFDHTLTDFPLLGSHGSVDCRACHTAQLTDPLAHSRCKDCHTDYHQGQFTSTVPQIDCADCHIEDSFGPSTFTIARHQETAFPLRGAHLATPCLACHRQDDAWEFREIGLACTSCHENVHQGYMDERFFSAGCAKCHNESTWTEITFDHYETSFQLEGAHTGVRCAQCHFSESETGIWVQEFTGLQSHCSGCHQDVHFGQFEIAGITECNRCHGNENWTASLFDHDSTQFVLDGVHAQIDCAGCHQETTQNNETYVIYKIERFACIDCHR